MARETIKLDGIEAACLAVNAGPLAVQPEWIEQHLALARAGVPLQVRGEDDDVVAVVQNNIAVIGIDGLLTKSSSKFGSSYIGIRKAIRQALADPSVGGIFLMIDSPGGTVGGIEETVRDIQMARARVPVVAHVDDLGASAAYRLIAGVDRITANASAIVGSIGTVAQLVDKSQALADAGIVVHTIATGPLKASGMKPDVSEADIKERRTQIDALNARFLAEVQQGRSLSGEQLERVSTGGVWVGQAAVSVGLVDEIQSGDDAIGSFRAMVAQHKKAEDRSQRMRGLRAQALAGRTATS